MNDIFSKSMFNILKNLTSFIMIYYFYLEEKYNRIIEQDKFTYSSLGKAFEKQIKTIGDQVIK